MSEPFRYGGQAVIEGVMMRGRQSMAVAVRHPTGEVVVHSEPLTSRVYRSAWAKRPFIRGVVMLWDTLALGMRALMFSASIAADVEEDEADNQEPSASTPPSVSHGNAPPEHANGSPAAASLGTPGGATTNDTAARANVQRPSAAEQAEAAAKETFGGGVMWGTMAFAVLFAIGLFFVSPLLLTRLVEPLLPPANILSVIVEGMFRLAIFFGYVWLIGRLPDVRRVFAYHGAEHKTINAYEAGEPLRPDRVGRYSVAHPRCGTSFLLFVVVLSIFVFGMLGRPSLPARIASRIVLVPVVASLAYEVIRFSARRYSNPAVRALMAPGMLLQSLTTREPDDSQVAVAIVALERVIELDTARAPAAPAETPALAPTG